MVSTDFRPFILKSFIIHIAIVIFILFIGNFSLNSFRTNLKLEQFRSAVRVDTVEMPRMTLKELKSLRSLETEKYIQAPAEEVMPEIVNPEDDVFIQKKKKEDFKKFLAKMSKRKISKKKRSKIRKKKIAKNPLAREKELEKLIIAGNKLSKGIMGGTGQVLEESKFSDYAISVREHVKRFWHLPQYLKKLDINCKVRVILKSTGAILKVEMYQSSGNKEYDERAIEAIKNSDPFPLYPNEIRVRIRRGDMILGFPL